jgi:hypothetical protein
MSLFVSIVHSPWSAVCVIFFTARQIGSDACFIPPGCDLRQMHKYLPIGGARISLVGPQLVHLLLSSRCIYSLYLLAFLSIWLPCFVTHEG